MEVIYKKYRDRGLEIFGLDAWNGSARKVKRFIEVTGVTFPVLRNASDYIKKLKTIDNRGTYFLLNKEGVVVASCDDGYKSLDCFEPARLDSVVGEYFSGLQQK